MFQFGFEGGVANVGCVLEMTQNELGVLKEIIVHGAERHRFLQNGRNCFLRLLKLTLRSDRGVNLGKLFFNSRQTSFKCLPQGLALLHKW